MVSRWTASGMLWAESGYRKVRGYADLRALKEALAQPGAATPDPAKLSQLDRPAVLQKEEKKPTLNPPTK